MASNRFPAFTSRDYRIYWFVQLISNTGTQMQFVALNWQIYVLTHSAFMLGLIGLIRFIPILLFSLIGGSVADVHNRKKILYITQCILALFAFILAITTYMHTIGPSIIFAITLGSAIVVSFDLPAMQSFVPSLVDRKHLANAMSFNSIMFQTATIAGPALAGIMIGHLGLAPIYFINGISFFLVIIGLFYMHASGKVVSSAQFSLKAIRDGISFIRSKTMIWSTMLLDFFCTFFASAVALLPIYAKDILAVGPTGLGLLYAAPSVGAVIASILVAHHSNFRHQGYVLLLVLFFFASATVVFGLSHTFIISFLALAVVGGSDGVSMIIRNTIRQLETPDNIRGRMTSVSMIFFMGGPQLGDFEAGALAGFVGAPLSVVTGGIGTFFVILFFAFAIPRLRQYDRHVSQME